MIFKQVFRDTVHISGDQNGYYGTENEKDCCGNCCAVLYIALPYCKRPMPY